MVLLKIELSLNSINSRIRLVVKQYIELINELNEKS